ncbi:hypothetical protein ACW6QP_01120 [Salegentibacter sp. HM20]
MDLKSRKLKIIDYLIHLNDENVVKEIESILYNEFDAEEFRKFSKEELIKRTQKSEKDIEAGRVISQEDVERKFNM